MPPFFPRPPPPPIPRPQNLFIYSTFTLNKSLKNYPKNFRCLNIETKQFNSLDSHQILSKFRLKTLQKRAKPLRILNLENHEQFFQLNISQALTLIKSYNYLTSLTLAGEINRYFLHKSYLKWLNQSKQLTHLAFGHLPLNFSRHILRFEDLFLLETVQAKYQKILRRTKLLSLDLKSSQSISSHSDLSYPVTLNKLSMSVKAILTRFRLNLSHLRHLSILHLDFLLFFKNILEALHSVPNPHKITHLTAFAPNVFDPGDRYPFKLPEVLTPFQSLNSLHLAINSFVSISTLLKSFQTPSKFCQLVLYIPIQKQKDLIELAELIGNFKNLSQLAIVNTTEIQGYASKGHRIFFTQISGLTQLKSLKIILNNEGITPLISELFYGCLGEFAGCVKTLQELQVIKFTQSELSIAPEFDLLADALKNNGSKVKKLKIKFFTKDKKIDHLAKLNKAFRAMKNLEKLSLENLWTKTESLIKFGEIISGLKFVRSVELHGVNPDLEKKDLVRTLKKIVMKYGLEDLKWFGNQPIRETNNNDFDEEEDFIDIKEVILRNPRLHSVQFNDFQVKSKGLVFKNVKDFLP